MQNDRQGRHRRRRLMKPMHYPTGQIGEVATVAVREVSSALDEIANTLDTPAFMLDEQDTRSRLTAREKLPIGIVAAIGKPDTPRLFLLIG
jgi:hypothetical protein